MQIKIQTLLAFNSDAMEEEVNKFLRSHRVMAVDRQFCPDHRGYWTLCVSYQENGVSQTASINCTGKSRRMVLSFSFYADTPIIRRVITKKHFAIAAQIPFIQNLPTDIGKTLKQMGADGHPFSTSEFTIALSLASLLRVPNPTNNCKSLSAAAHNNWQ